MKITVLANRDLASNFALNLLLPELNERHELRVFLSSHVGSAKAMPPELLELAFFEQTLWNDLLFPALEGKSEQGTLLSFDQLGQTVGHEVGTLNRVNAPESLKVLREASPDLMISIRYGSILRDEAISAAKHGVLNLHSGVLPQYRGVMATFRALMNGDTELGTTLHYISDASIDTGEIIGETRLAVENGRSYLWHVLQLYPAGCRLLLETVEKIRSGKPVETRPQSGGGAYYSFPTSEELRAFREAGHRLYDLDEVTEFAKQYLVRG